MRDIFPNMFLTNAIILQAEGTRIRAIVEPYLYIVAP